MNQRSHVVTDQILLVDTKSVGDIVTQLQDDAGLLQAFTGEPIRMVVMNLASMLVAVILAFIFMWPFALLFIAVLPFMALGSIFESRLEVESDEADEEDEDGPGSVALESMTYIRTVAALTLEKDRYNRYLQALRRYNKASVKRSFLAGMSYGLGQLLQQFCAALIFWWGGWLLVNYPTFFSSTDFYIALSGVLLALNGLSLSAHGVTNKKEAEAAAKRVAELMDRESSIDPLSDKGKKDL